MAFISIFVGILLLLVLVTVVKLDTFISFMLVCLFIGLYEGLSISEVVGAIQLGIGNTLGSLVIILGFGAMLGKLVAESGAATQITNTLVDKFGLKNIQIALMITGFIVGIPMFYSVGFVILVPLVFTIAASTRLPLMYIALPMLASLSVTHGYLPPHPAPTAIAEMYGADMGLTLIYGMIVGIPAIFTAKFTMSGMMKKMHPNPSPEFFKSELDPRYPVPGIGLSLGVALLPVVLIGGSSLLKLFFGEHVIITALGDPAIAMLVSVLAAIYFLGVRTGRNMKEIADLLGRSVSSIAVVLLVIAGAGSLKEIFIATEISTRLGDALDSLGMSPILLAWVIAALMRISVGSATVAGLTAASIMMPMVGTSGVSAELLVLATGAGSIMLSHVNDSGFWLFKEYFNLSIKETLMSWSMMETIVSIMGLIGVLLLNLFV
ncbi:MAG: gluconate:H+ symporter [Cyclobacteriaceae bacterium]|nr:gluconate:H+ symporter [Cyclobacteriaceae bacterium]